MSLLRRLFEGGAFIKAHTTKTKLLQEYFSWFTGLKAILNFGFHNTLVNTFLLVFNNAPLDVNVLTLAESSQDLTQGALYLSLSLKTLTYTRNNTRINAVQQMRCLFEGGAY